MARNYAQLFAICKKHGFDYKDKVAEFTNGRTESLKALTDGEYREFMIRLQRLNPQPPKGGFMPKLGDAQRKKMLGIANQMRWGSTNTELVTAVNEWCQKQKYKKDWMQLTVPEINTLLTIFETKVLVDYYKNLNG